MAPRNPKPIDCQFKETTRTVEIELGHSEEQIYEIVKTALADIIEEGKEIEIRNLEGGRTKLEYPRLDTTTLYLVYEVAENLHFGPTSRTGKTNTHLIRKIKDIWKLGDSDCILPDGHIPRYVNSKGHKCTKEDIKNEDGPSLAKEKPETQWSNKLLGNIWNFAKETPEQPDLAKRWMAREVLRRNNSPGDPQQDIVELLDCDVRLAITKYKAPRIQARHEREQKEYMADIFNEPHEREIQRVAESARKKTEQQEVLKLSALRARHDEVNGRLQSLLSLAKKLEIEKHSLEQEIAACPGATEEEKTKVSVSEETLLELFGP
ncbi:hypothetical protein BDV96DRAFT_604435 [Lophiotrema nucula]|uniref:Uncharacterized protein n=1 Tax=Lophiotrema nucula TaxID=690887 RepID=A0A6A5YSI5_9PLEO|nr:hypothetical protein BDV96DRAFT_604435 [Lophiotrema nucula]